MKAAITFAIALTALVATASPARAQGCTEGVSFCGFVWDDTNGDGIQNDDPDPVMDGDQSGLSDLTVTLYKFDSGSGLWVAVPGADTVTSDGFYSFLTPSGGFDAGLYKVVVSAPMGQESTLQGQGGDNTLDSDGVSDAGGSSQQVQFSGGFASQEFDFGFKDSEVVVVNPGTGTQGYWKNHPEAWPAAGITIGGTTYTWETAHEYMGKVSKNKVISLFVQLVAAKLNVAIGNDASCIAGRIAEADAWMALHPVEGPAVLASSAAWLQIAAAHKDLDDYNNGRLCAPHRN